MPKLVCRSCGQGVYTTAPFEQLFADERRCPRCGQLLFSDRRSGSMRRKAQRRRPVEADVATNTAPATNGAPITGPRGNASAPDDASTSTRELEMPVGTLVATEAERRVGERRQIRRRREDHNPFQRASEEAGWVG